MDIYDPIAKALHISPQVINETNTNFIEFQKPEAWNKGIPHSEESKQLMRENLKGKRSGSKNPMFGKPAWNKGKKLGKYPPERVKAAAEGLKGHIPWNKGLTKEDPRVKNNVEKMKLTRYGTPT
jgi:hypothetical protein